MAHLAALKLHESERLGHVQHRALTLNGGSPGTYLYMCVCVYVCVRVCVHVCVYVCMRVPSRPLRV